jgi:hypothetical protein
MGLDLQRPPHVRLATSDRGLHSCRCDGLRRCHWVLTLVQASQRSDRTHVSRQQSRYNYAQPVVRRANSWLHQARRSATDVPSCPYHPVPPPVGTAAQFTLSDSPRATKSSIINQWRFLHIDVNELHFRYLYTSLNMRSRKSTALTLLISMATKHSPRAVLATRGHTWAKVDLSVVLPTAYSTCSVGRVVSRNTWRTRHLFHSRVITKQNKCFNCSTRSLRDIYRAVPVLTVSGQTSGSWRSNRHGHDSTRTWPTHASRDWGKLQ